MNSKKQLKTTLPKYNHNPSVEDLSLQTRNKRVFIQNNKALIITDARTGEQMTANAGATFVRPEIVDTEQFIKIYTSGVAQLAELSGAGHKMFSTIYKIMLNAPNNDRLHIEYNDLTYKKLWQYTQKTFISGINDLLKNNIIFQTISPNVFFINVKFFFNGDRINIVKSYQLKQVDMFDEQNFLEWTNPPKKGG